LYSLKANKSNVVNPSSYILICSKTPQGQNKLTIGRKKIVFWNSQTTTII